MLLYRISHYFVTSLVDTGGRYIYLFICICIDFLGNEGGKRGKREKH